MARVPEYQCLFGRVEVNVPISAADPCGGHRERSHQAAAESERRSRLRTDASMNTHSAAGIRDAEPGMREKYYVAAEMFIAFLSSDAGRYEWPMRPGGARPLNAVPRAYRYRPACRLYPSPIQTEVSVVFGLPMRCAITEQELKSGSRNL